MLVILSDLHVGSNYSLMPKGFHNQEGAEIGLNPLQEWIHEQWESMWDTINKKTKGKEWSCILNGDLIDGYHHGTKEIWSHDESEHGIAAFHILKDRLEGAKNVFVIEGTESHTKQHEHHLARELHRKNNNVVMPEKGAAWATLDLEMNNTFVRVDHHISTTTRPYLEAGVLSATLGTERIERSRAGARVPDLIFRAHRHRFGHFNDGYGQITVTPPWQALTRWARKVVPHALLQVGGVIVDWDDNKPRVTELLYNKTVSAPHVIL